jgi:hypothetical protein
MGKKNPDLSATDDGGRPEHLKMGKAGESAKKNEPKKLQLPPGKDEKWWGK